MKIVWLRQAINDRKRQLRHIAAHNIVAAIAHGDRIDTQVDLLKRHPQLGRQGRKKSTRELVVSQTPFIVVYRISTGASQIEILRVLHGSQRWPK